MTTFLRSCCSCARTAGIIRGQNTLMVKLRDFELKDVAAMGTWTMDKRISPYVLWDAYTNLKDVERYLKETVLVHPWYKAIVDQDTVVGSITLDKDPSNPRKAELGYVIAYDAWNKGIGTAAVGLALATGFTDLQVTEIEAFVDPDNQASIRVCEKNDMRLAERLEKKVYHQGTWKSRLRFVKEASS